jgi:CRP/FNR family transcriptional regulator, dissimilatory nitrate respiration regulator
MYDVWISIISASPLFRGIGHEALNIMLECLKPRIKKSKQREIVAVAGQPFDGIGIVASGRVALTRETYSGNRIMLEILDAGEIFGEVIAFSDNKVWPVTVIAEEDSEVLFLPPQKITGNCANICASHNTLIMNTLNILSSRAQTLGKKIEYLSARTIRGRVSSYLLDMFQRSDAVALHLPMKRHELADYLGMPRPSLSRELGLMRDAGILEFDGASVKIRDIILLEKSIE